MAGGGGYDVDEHGEIRHPVNTGQEALALMMGQLKRFYGREAQLELIQELEGFRTMSEPELWDFLDRRSASLANEEKE